jgi:hypothetical protein
MAGEVGVAQLGGALALLCLFALGGGLSALGVTAAATVVLVALCAVETLQPAAGSLTTKRGQDAIV